LFAANPNWRAADAAALRFAGALNAAVLSGRAPELAQLYPPIARSWDIDLVWRAARAAITADPAWFETFLQSPPQTNETRRAIALLPAFLELAASGPLHMRELGASAGLNLNWDAFRYETEVWSWGGAAPGAPVIDTEWRGAAPPIDNTVYVSSRAGCDAAPIDLDDPDARLRLKAYVWPDQEERIARLERAMALAIDKAVEVERADAGAWLEAKLADAPPPGVTVIYHSVAWQYFSKETRARAEAAIADFAARTTPERQLAWVRFEHDRVFGDAGEGYTVDLRRWPDDGASQAIAHVDPHVRWVETA
ncbi:MAG: DUF2332 domain-containing protein, partial [Maricaulaceae bacterium]|jgi:hypothetical protein